MGTDKLSGKVNYLIGNAPEKWHKNIPTYAKVRYREIYPGVDMVLYGNGGRFEYDFVIAPGADPGLIALGFEGIGDLKLDEKGNLELSAGSEQLTMHKPFVYQETAGATKEIEGSFVLKGKNQIGFQLGKYDESKPLVIDPVVTLNYSTYLGGDSWDYGYCIAVDGSGCVYMAGATNSTNFPVHDAYQAINAGEHDVFITKVNAAGNAIIYSTYLGGSDYDDGNGIAVDSSGCAYVTGYTSSTDFPLKNAFQSTFKGVSEVFITKLDAAGDELIYSTYLGGDNWDRGYGIAVDGDGCAYVTGYTMSTDFPVRNAYQSTLTGFRTAFITKMNTAGNDLIYSTYLGGSGSDYSNGIAVDSSGCVYVAGSTDSTDFPVLNAYQSLKNGLIDVFITKLSADGNSLVFSTYLGGAGSDYCNGIAVDGDGCAYVTGTTRSTDFPVRNAYQSTLTGFDTAFITKMNTAGDDLIYSTYLGGSGNNTGWSIVTDASGCAYVTGYTTSTDFPVKNAYQSANAGGSDVFVTKLSAAGNALIYSTYLGGSDTDIGRGIAVDTGGRAYVTGYTQSANFPTQNPVQAALGGLSDAFVFKITYTDPPSKTRGLDFFQNFSGSDENRFNIRISGSLP